MSDNKKLAEKKPLFNKTQLVGIILAAAAIAAMYLITPTEALTRAGINTIGLLVATICLLICRSLPMATLGILLVPLLYFTGVAAKPAEALAGYSNPVTFFIFASFGITAAITNTPVAKRMMRWIIHRADGVPAAHKLYGDAHRGAA